MFSGLLNPRGNERRSRSKSPGVRKSRETVDDYSSEEDKRSYRKPARGKYSVSESDDEPETPRYVDRTPDAYEPRASKNDRPRTKQADDCDYNRKPSNKYATHELEDARPVRGRKERDPYDFAETPKSARPNNAMYTNGQTPQYAAFAGNGTVPGGFPGQSVKPPPQREPQPQPKSGQYEMPGQLQYAQINPADVQYNYNNGTGSRQSSYSAYGAVPAKPAKPSIAAQQKTYNDDRHTRKPSSRQQSEEAIKTIAESGRRQSYHRERSPVAGNPGGLSAEALRKNLGRLSTNGQTLGVGMTPTTAGGRPPASPLLEAYKGTYQSISPMPSPLALALRPKDDDDLSDLDLSESGSDDDLTKKIKALQREKQRLGGGPKTSSAKLDAPPKKSRTSSNALVKTTKQKKAVSFYDPEADARKIEEALKGTHRSADPKPLLKILPWLTTDEIIHLKNAYKNIAKLQGKGINLSKHIKARIQGNLGKILYATTLGQYESDAYWANCFYQSGASRRELLIESLVGRSNQTIREIKDVFKDKRYDDDLEKCMRAELKADKFRVAILLALEERRMPEGLGIDMRLVHEDGQDLYEALNSSGGETDMIKIVMMRSDDHLREVMRYYEKSYRRNFARDMISKSQNLVVGLTLLPVI